MKGSQAVDVVEVSYVYMFWYICVFTLGEI